VLLVSRQKLSPGRMREMKRENDGQSERSSDGERQQGGFSHKELMMMAIRRISPTQFGGPLKREPA